MAKVTGGLLSLGASGTIAKTQVYGSWRGINYVRKHVVPANPKTTSQMETRDVFSFLQQAFKLFPALVQDTWTLTAKGQPLTNRNAFSKANISNLRLATDLAAFTFSTGAKGGLAPSAAGVTPGSGSLVVAVTAPDIPFGWTITRAIAAVIRDQDPHSGVLYDTIAGSDTTSPYSITLSGLTSGQVYRVGAWLLWTKADGFPAYGPAVMTVGTPS